MVLAEGLAFLKEAGSPVTFEHLRSLLIKPHREERGRRVDSGARMSILATCPGCNKSYQLADTQRGKRVRCKSCSEVFVVPGKTVASDRDEDEERIQTSPHPAKRIVRDEEDEDLEQPPLRRRPLKKGGNSATVPLLYFTRPGVRHSQTPGS